MENKSQSVEKIFKDGAEGENFFDQLSSNSAMMTSIAQSSSQQDIFGEHEKKDEPVICKIFADSPTVIKNNDFFDHISPIVDTPDGDMMALDLNDEGPYPSPLQGFEDGHDILCGPETFRTREAWISSEATRKALILAVTSPGSSFTPDKQLLTTPGIVLDKDLSCDLTELVRKTFGEEEARKRTVKTCNDVPEDEKGLQELINKNYFKAAVNLTRKILTNVYHQGTNTRAEHSVNSIQIWFTRFCLLVKLGYFKEVFLESNPWWNLDRPDLYYQFYPHRYGAKLGTMVPFQMRLLIATVPAYVSKCQLALERLYSLATVVKQILKNLNNGVTEDGSLIELSPKEREMAKKIWSSRDCRIQHSIINVALMSRKYTLAVEVLQMLVKKTQSRNQKRALTSALGRIFLEMGDLKNADKCFKEAKSLKVQQQGTLSADTADLRELVDKGLFLVAEKNHEEAYECFQKALMLERSNVMVLNNMSFCLLYMGRLKKAIETLVSAIKAHPSTALNEALLLNVWTLFDLASSDLAQKHDLLRDIAKFEGDGLNVDRMKALLPR